MRGVRQLLDPPFQSHSTPMVHPSRQAADDGMATLWTTHQQAAQPHAEAVVARQSHSTPAGMHVLRMCVMQGMGAGPTPVKGMQPQELRLVTTSPDGPTQSRPHHTLPVESRSHQQHCAAAGRLLSAPTVWRQSRSLPTWIQGCCLHCWERQGCLQTTHCLAA